MNLLKVVANGKNDGRKCRGATPVKANVALLQQGMKEDLRDDNHD